MLVLRLETNSGTGVFEGGGVYSMLDRMPYDIMCQIGTPTQGPSPYSDRGLGNIRCTERCGFANFDQYRKWFEHPMMDEILHECGYDMSIYDAPGAKQGEWQVIFDREFSTKVDRQPCSVLRDRYQRVSNWGEHLNRQGNIVPMQWDVCEMAWDALMKLEERKIQCLIDN